MNKPAMDMFTQVLFQTNMFISLGMEYHRSRIVGLKGRNSKTGFLLFVLIFFI